MYHSSNGCAKIMTPLLEYPMNGFAADGFAADRRARQPETLENAKVAGSLSNFDQPGF
jgi:hypothetical protein